MTPRLIPSDDPLWRRLEERPVKARLVLAWMRARRSHRLSRITGSRLGALPTDFEHVDDLIEIRIAGRVVTTVPVDDLLGGV